jgi:hypothetical protein
VDEQTFDRWAVDVSQRPTRRATLRLIAGGLLVGLLSWRSAGLSRAQDNCGGCPAGHVCVGGVCLVLAPPPRFFCLFQGLDDCGGVCVDVTTDDRNCGACGVACEPFEACVDGACVGPPCGVGLTSCNRICVDLDDDPWHCGACGNSCPIGSYCDGGRCVSSGYFCTTLGLTECDGFCVDIMTDPDHCGGCNIACYNEGARCIAGQYCE